MNGNFSKIFASIILSVISFNITIFAQKTGEMYLPPQRTNMPEWAKMLYQNPINIRSIEEAIRDLKQKNLGKEVNDLDTLPRENENSEFEEANKSEYELYLKRMLKYHRDQIDENGFLNLNEQNDQTKPAPPSPSMEIEMRKMAFGDWKIIGPKETFYLNQDNPAQPPCPWQVNVYSISACESNPAILYAAPETGGIYKTEDQGLTWECKTESLNTGTFSEVAVNPINSDFVLAGKSGVVYKSTNGGTSWTSINTPMGQVNGFAFHPSDQNKVFAATSTGLFKSIDAGATWTLITGMNTTCYDVFFKIGDNSKIFTLRKTGSMIECWKSSDSGVTFLASTSGWYGKGINDASGARMTVTAANPNVIYAVLLGSAPSPTKPYIFKTLDEGVTWDTTATGITSGLTRNTNQPLGMSNGQGFYDLDIIANPNDENHVIVATTTAYKSTNGGSTFSRIGGYGGAFSIHPDIQSMIAIGGDTWIATDGGISISNDFFTNTANYNVRTNGITGSDYWGFAQGWNENVIGGGRYHNGNDVQSENYVQGNSLRLGGGEAPTGYYMLGRPNHIGYSDIGGIVVPQAFNNNLKYFNLNKYPNEDGYGWDASEVDFLPYCFNTLFVGNGNELWKSIDGGLSWQSLYNFGQKVKKFKISRSNPQVIYLATETSLYKSLNQGTSWQIVSLPSGCSISRLKIEVSATNEDRIWLSSPSNNSSNRIFTSNNGGGTWTNMTTPTMSTSAVQDMACHDGTSNGIYIICNGGLVYYKDDGMSDWINYSAGLTAGFNPLSMKIFYRDHKIRAAGNRGIWETSLHQNTLPIAQPTINKLTSNCPKDTFYLEDYSIIHHKDIAWQWSINPAPLYISDANIRNPKVVFGVLGDYSVSLTVTNVIGTDTKSIPVPISLVADLCSIDTLPGHSLKLIVAGDYAQPTGPINITTNTLTLSCWIKPEGVQLDFAGILFSSNDGATGFNFMTNNRLGYHWQNTSSSYNWTGGPIVPVNEWSHIALVISPSTVTIYLNGTPYSRSATHNAVTFNNSFQFGIDRSNISRNFKGEMDEICFYNRALTTTEIQNLMHLTKNNPNSGTLPIVDNSLINYYQFNEGSDVYPAFDKVGLIHANLIGGASKAQPSSAPLGGGIYERLNIATSGQYQSPLTGLNISFGPGTNPNGNIVISRIHNSPNIKCMADVLPEPNQYWIVRNFGSNSTFTGSTSMAFHHVNGMTLPMATSPNKLSLFKRTSNASDASWQSISSGSNATLNPSTSVGSVFFDQINQSGFSQFQIGVDNTIFPMLLEKFEASLKQENVAMITWKITHDHSFDKGILYSSIDGTNFQKIHEFDVNISKREYNYLDYDLFSKGKYYNLRLYDKNNKIVNSPIRYVSNPSSIESYSIFPNPSSGWFTLESKTSDMNAVKVVVYTIDGKYLTEVLLENLKYGQRQHFGISLSPGEYFFHLVSSEGRKKIVPITIIK